MLTQSTENLLNAYEPALIKKKVIYKFYAQKMFGFYLSPQEEKKYYISPDMNMQRTSLSTFEQSSLPTRINCLFGKSKR